MDDAELDAILATSIRHNEKQQVTGMLLYSNGSFMQALEGEAAVIDETYRRICEDPRHHDIQLIYREAITERDFPNWSMGFRRLETEDADAHPAFAPYFTNGFASMPAGDSEGLALQLLKHFSRR
jgi:hypothetical protein